MAIALKMFWSSSIGDGAWALMYLSRASRTEDKGGRKIRARRRKGTCGHGDRGTSINFHGDMNYIIAAKVTFHNIWETSRKLVQNSTALQSILVVVSEVSIQVLLLI